MTDATEVGLRRYGGEDAAPVTAMLLAVFRAAETYCVDPDITPADALAYWTGGSRSVFVAEEAGVPVGTYYLVRNQGGGGAHVCNCGFVTATAAQGRGVARAMLTHALTTARDAGFRAMQFNFVVETNRPAIALWQSAGFRTLARVPEAFRHPRLGYVDALVMHRFL